MDTANTTTITGFSNQKIDIIESICSKLTKLIFKEEMIFLIPKFTVSLRKEKNFYLLFVLPCKKITLRLCLPFFSHLSYSSREEPVIFSVNGIWLGCLEKGVMFVIMCPNDVHDA